MIMVNELILRISYEKDTVKKLCNYWVEILNIDNSQKKYYFKHVILMEKSSSIKKSEEL